MLRKKQNLKQNGKIDMLIGKVHQDVITQVRVELVVKNLKQVEHLEQKEQVQIGELKVE